MDKTQDSTVARVLGCGPLLPFYSYDWNVFKVHLILSFFLSPAVIVGKSGLAIKSACPTDKSWLLQRTRITQIAYNW
jgi:hypothetical protein